MLGYPTLPGLTANGNVGVSTFVAPDPSNDWMAVQATAGSVPIGVAEQGTKYPPDPILAPNGYAAQQGDPLLVFAAGAVVPLQSSASAGFPRHVYLKPGADGAVQAYPGDIAGAYSIEAAGPGEIRRVVVLPPTPVPASSGAISTVAANATATPGQVIFANGGSLTITLPSVASCAGTTVQVYAAASTATLDAGTGTLLKLNAADVTNSVMLYGDGITPTAGYGLINTAASAKQGDNVVLYSDGTSWWVRSVVGTWASHS